MAKLIKILLKIIRRIPKNRYSPDDLMIGIFAAIFVCEVMRVGLVNVAEVQWGYYP